MTTPLVTGATGFAGGHLVEHLLEHAPRIAAWGHAGGRNLPAWRDERVSWSAVDVTDGEAVTRSLDQLRPSAIYHCAGIADVHGTWSASTRALRVNVIGTHTLLGAVEQLQLDIPILVTGSALVYGSSLDALTEDSPLAPSSPYGVSKLGQEMTANLAPGHVVLTRSFNHAGPRQSDAYVTSSFARQIA
jgi:GDP-4-dehydro-6-deoxy-D-mannose reductase